jgi:hypothetical protein
VLYELRQEAHLRGHSLGDRPSLTAVGLVEPPSTSRPFLDLLPGPHQSDRELDEWGWEVRIAPTPRVHVLMVRESEPLGDLGRAGEVGDRYRSSHLTLIVVERTVSSTPTTVVSGWDIREDGPGGCWNTPGALAST